MGIDNWSVVSREYGNMLNERAISLRLPNREELTRIGIDTGSAEVLQQRNAALMGIVARTLGLNSRYLENDLRLEAELNQGQSIVICPSMPATEDCRIILIDKDHYYRQHKTFLPDRGVNGIIELEVAKRLISELTRIWGVIPRGFLYDRKLLPGVLKRLRPYESLAVLSFLRKEQIFEQSLILSVFRNHYSEERPMDKSSSSLVFTKYKVFTGERTETTVPIREGSPRVYYHDRGFVVDTKRILPYIESTIPRWMREINVVLKTILLRHAGLEVK